MAPIPRLDPVLRDATGELLLRRATQGDSEFAFAMREGAFRVYVDKSGGWDEQEERRRHERNFAIYDYRVISLRGTARGIMSLEISRDGITLNQLFLAPEHQDSLARHEGQSSRQAAVREAELRGHWRNRDAFHDGEATVTGSLTRAMGKSSESPATDAPCAPFRQAEGSCRFSQPRPPPRASALVQRESTTR